jgi:hypothetical protein
MLRLTMGELIGYHRVSNVIDGVTQTDVVITGFDCTDSFLIGCDGESSGSEGMYCLHRW